MKTSTGFSKGGATVEDVALLYGEAQKLGLRVKAAGGIRDYATAKAMIAAGAERLGCSAGVKLAEEEKQEAGGAEKAGSVDETAGDAAATSSEEAKA